MQCSTRYLLPCTLLPQILKTSPTYSPSTSPEQYSQTQLPPLTIRKMSTRRSPRSRPHPNDTRITDDQISDLVSSLQRLIPELRHPRSEKVPASRVLQETCNYIRSLHREVDDLSDRLALLLGSDGADSDQADLIRSMLMF